MSLERGITRLAIQAEWDTESIRATLEEKREQIRQELKYHGEEPRTLRKQVIILKTQNSPDLVDRFLSHLLINIRNTEAQSTVEVGILDDSTPQVVEVDYNEVLETYRQKGVKIHYFRVNEQNSGSFIGRLRNRALELMNQAGKSRYEKQKMLLALQILISEEMRLPKHLDHDPDKRTDGYIAAHYSTMGKGHQSTDNLGSLLGAFILGSSNTPLNCGIITHNDDDIIYATLSSPRGIPEFKLHDYLAEREILFRDPQTEFSAGKYVGVSGSPIRNISTALDIAVGILEMDKPHISPNAPSPYYVFDSRTSSFKALSVREALEALPDIIESFLNRTPNTGFKTRESFLPWLNSRNLRFDQGNFSMIGTLERQFPSPTGGIIEFVQTGVLKTLARKKYISRFFRIEEPILHVRAPRSNGGDAFPRDIIGGCY